MRTPLSTYRLQLHGGFTLRDARELLPYLRDLGVDWVYAAPVLATVPGSTHGYDATDVTRLNPELGDEDDWRDLHERRRELGLGWLQDIVPNHQAYDLASPWVHAMLRHGEASTAARHFDVDWRHPSFRGRVMLPILGHELDEAIAAGHVRIDPEARVVRVYDRELPMSARSLGKLAAGVTDTRTLLDAQHYALTHWRDTEREIGYRRFFTVNGLIGLRQERRETFAATHAKILAWVRAGDIDGLRVDHVDGLLDPTGYLLNLREAVGAEVPIYVEKILERGERLHARWPVQGTTGYDALAAINQVLRPDPRSPREDGLYGHGLSVPSCSAALNETDVDALLAANKRLVLERQMAGELDNVLHQARGALAGLPLGMQPELLRAALTAWLIAFPVYRAYPRRGRLTEAARRVLVEAADRASAAEWASEPERRAVGELRAWLRSITTLDERSATFLQRAMQLSGPLMAKGLEDTTFYQHEAEIACNEVGDSPAPEHALDVDGYHDFMAARRPGDLNAGSTHDTKRAEDARARLHAAAADPEAYHRLVVHPAEQLLCGLSDRPLPLAGFLLQSLVAAWPLGVHATDLSQRLGEARFAERLQATMQKALRESKVFSDWAEPNAEREARTREAIDLLLADGGFVAGVDAYVRDLQPLEWLATVRGLVLRCTSPGAPDVYQGTAFRDHAMVDPDNRRPVDFGARQVALASAKTESGATRWDVPADAHKLALLRALLRMRQTEANLWRQGDYVPLAVRGEGPSASVVAYRRVWGDDSALVVVALGTPGGGAWPKGEAFGALTVDLPRLRPSRELLSGRERVLQGAVPMADLLAEHPVAVWSESPAGGTG